MSTESTNEIEETASDWLIRRESGQWTDADQVRFEQWLAASTLNRVAFLRLEHAWEESARLTALGAGVSGELPPPPGRWNFTPFFEPHQTPSEAHGLDSAVAQTIGAGHAVSRASPHWLRRLAIAAGILLIVAAGFGAYALRVGSGERYTTPIGGLASVPMRDGSKITLNTNSQVRVALTAAERRVDLRQGEAFFEVAGDPNRPFVVDAGRKRVVAVGTRFSVRRDGDSIEVVVTEGKVRVEDTTRLLHGRTVEAPGLASRQQDADDPIFLTPGAIARADDSGVLVQRKTLAEAETHLSWRHGILMFREQDLADVVAEFNRYNERKIVIADLAVAGLKVEGNFRATNVDAFVRLLESGFPVRATSEEDRIILMAR